MTADRHEESLHESVETAVLVEEAPLLPRHHLETEQSSSSPPTDPSIIRRTISAGWDSGTACVGVAAFLFAFQASLVKIAHQRGVPVFQIVVVRSVLSMFLSIAAALARGSGPIYGQPRHWHLLAIRGLVGATAMCVFYESLARLPLADAITIIFCNPALCSIFAWALLGEGFGIMTFLGCLASIGGVVLVARPPLLFGEAAGVHEEWTSDRALGMALAFGGAFLTAGAYLAIRVIGKREPPLTLAMWFHTSAALSNGIPLLLGYPDHAVLPDAIGWLCLLGIGGCSFIAQLLLNRGFQLQVAAKAAAVNYTQVIYAHAFGAIFFHESLSLLGILGALLIAVGVVTVNADKKSTPGPTSASKDSGQQGGGVSGREEGGPTQQQGGHRQQHGEGSGGAGAQSREEEGEEEGQQMLFYRDHHGRLKAKPSFNVSKDGRQLAARGGPEGGPAIGDRLSANMEPPAEQGLLLAAHRGGGITNSTGT